GVPPGAVEHGAAARARLRRPGDARALRLSRARLAALRAVRPLRRARLGEPLRWRGRSLLAPRSGARMLHVRGAAAQEGVVGARPLFPSRGGSGAKRRSRAGGAWRRAGAMEGGGSGAQRTSANAWTRLLPDAWSRAQ